MNAAVLLAVAITTIAGAAQEEQVVALLGSKSNYEILQKADRVDACPLIIDWQASADAGRTISSEGTYVSLSAWEAAHLKTKLAAPESYAWGNEEKDCIPDYHLRVRFWRGSDRLDVDFCFGCDILQFHGGTETSVAQPKMFGRKNFDPSSKELFLLFLRLFPDDPTMRLLKTKRDAGKKR